MGRYSTSSRTTQHEGVAQYTTLLVHYQKPSQGIPQTFALIELHHRRPADYPAPCLLTATDFFIFKTNYDPFLRIPVSVHPPEDPAATFCLFLRPCASPAVSRLVDHCPCQSAQSGDPLCNHQRHRYPVRGHELGHQYHRFAGGH